ncbi:hypothetical protein N7468_010112 [Penicillium chermesinum]|uniref:Uncharacterized protein n=1 Tax=Penicillium chermesinum TaxID=63820 RepID=A0A9W9NDU2_9EURO|nr:uncharacterized protein N7468_010112 [Penicillium chermesinum]KAJ5217104.1 hypothetical protein N7468_010112 [Penicillium chermesinum]
MPLVTYKPSPGTHAVLPITLWTTCSLILALCYLQTIYFISFLARPCWTSPREFPPFQHSIEHAERLTVDIILSIVPFARYHSPPHTSLFSTENLLRPAAATYAGRTINHGITGPVTPPSFTRPSIPGSSPITAPEHVQLVARTVEASTITPQPSRSKTSITVYDAGKRVTAHSPTRPPLSAIVDIRAPSPSQQGINASRLLAPKEENSERSDQEDDFQDAQLSIPRALPSAAVYKNARPGSKSPAISLLSLEGPRDLAAAKRALEPRTAAAEGARQVRSKFGGRQKCHSTESYPGKFPVSEGMEFSELATAEYAFREKGTTTVRPFSDY